MLWAQLDDSAIHDLKTGRLRRYALGGGVATHETWLELKSVWNARLWDSGNPNKIEWFHYTEWKRARLGKAREGQPFYGWPRAQLEQLLTDLARVISKREVHYLCASVRAVASKRAVRDSYLEVVKHVITRAEQIPRWMSQEDQISFRLSDHAEVGGIRIQRFFDLLKKIHPLTEACIIGDPRSDVPLQIADLIVNHMARSRNMRASFGPKFLMPFMTEVMQLLKREPPFHHMIEWHKDDDLESPED
jgi:hypothetical protein